MSNRNSSSSKKIIHENLQYHAALGFYKNGISQAKNITKEKGNKIFEIAGYFGSICATDFGLLVPGISV